MPSSLVARTDEGHCDELRAAARWCRVRERRGTHESRELSLDFHGTPFSESGALKSLVLIDKDLAFS